MSLRVMTDVFFDSKARGTDKLVLLALADEADDQGGSCYPSMRRIAEKSSLSVGGVRNAIRRLEELGELVVSRPERQGRGLHNRYRVVIHKGAPDALFEGEERVQRVHETPVKGAPLARANPVPKGTDPRPTVPMVGSPESEACDECCVRGGRHRYDCKVALLHIRGQQEETRDE